MTGLVSPRERMWQLAVRLERPLRALRRLLLLAAELLARGLRRLPGDSRGFGPPRRHTWDTRGWAAQAGRPVVDVAPAWVTDRAPVQAGGQPVPHQFGDSERWPMPATFVVTLPQARVWGPDAIVVDASDTVLADQTNALGLRADQLAIMRRLRLGTPRRVPGTTATIWAAYADSYHHWMLDVLPRLAVLEQAALPFDRLLAPSTLRFQQETLARAGYPADRLLPRGEDDYLLADTLLVPSMPGTPGQAPPLACRFLRRLFAAEIDGVTGGRRLYLSRSDADRRKPANEPELQAALERLGFEAVTMGGRTVAEQARLFAQAEVVVAPHGGALTNLVFCRPGTAVVELFPPGYAPVCFWTVTDAVGLRYRPLFDERAPSQNGNAQWAAYTVRPRRVLDALTGLGVS